MTRLNMIKTIKVKGFTVIELMITVAVAGTILALAIPSFTEFLQRNRLNSEIERWQSDIAFARNEAITRNAQVSFCRFPASATCDGTSNCSCDTAPAINGVYHEGWLIFVDNSDTGHFRPGAGDDDILLKKASAAAPGVTIRGSGNADRRFSFTPNGELHPRDFPANTVFCYDDESTTKALGTRIAYNRLGRPTPVQLAAGDDCDGYQYNVSDAEEIGN